jgi:hypothetical protein
MKFTPFAIALLSMIRLAWSGCAVTPQFESKSEFVDSVLSKARSHPGYLFSKPDTFTIHKDTSWQDYTGTKELRVVRHRAKKFMTENSDSGSVIHDTTDTRNLSMHRKSICKEYRVKGKTNIKCSGGDGYGIGSSSSCPGPVNFRDRTILVFTADSTRRGTREYGFCSQWSRDRNWFFIEGDSIADRSYSMGLSDLREALKAP